jgi:hypothetical protein
MELYLADDGGLDADESGSFSAAAVDEGVGPKAEEGSREGWRCEKQEEESLGFNRRGDDAVCGSLARCRWARQVARGKMGAARPSDRARAVAMGSVTWSG